MLDLPINAVHEDALALRHVGTFVVAFCDTLADVGLVAAGIVAVELAVVVLVSVLPVAAVSPLFARGDGRFRHFLAVGVDVVVDFLGDVTGGVVGEEAWIGVTWGWSAIICKEAIWWDLQVTEFEVRSEESTVGVAAEALDHWE